MQLPPEWLRRRTHETFVLTLAAVAVACPAPDDDAFYSGEDNDLGVGRLCPEGVEDLFNDSFSPYHGGEDAVDLVVQAFEYFRCPPCGEFAAMAHGLWDDRDDYRRRVRFTFHHSPFAAVRVHAATVAAGAQGMQHFWAMHDYLFDGLSRDQTYTPERLARFAETELGLDMERYAADVDSEETRSFLEWDKAQLYDQGFDSTPSVFVCGQEASWELLEDVIDLYIVE